MEIHNKFQGKNVCGLCNKTYIHQVNLLKHLKNCVQNSKIANPYNNDKDDVCVREIKVETDYKYEDDTVAEGGGVREDSGGGVEVGQNAEVKNV